MTVPNVIILAGGRGTRLPESARDIPKTLVPIAGKPILEHQLELISRAGLSRVRLALGFRADQITAFVRERGYTCETVVEPSALGTGGGVRFAARGLSGPFLVLNGDIVSDLDLRAVLNHHRPGKAVMTAHWREDTGDFGLLDIHDGRIREFREKSNVAEPGFINAGCYVLEHEHLALLPEGFSMLERDLFPILARTDNLIAYEHRGEWEDVGTELRLRRTRERLTANQ